MSVTDTTDARSTKPTYKHSPITIEHQGIHAQIMADGKTKLTKPAGPPDDDGIIEYDEIIVPASLVFKLATLLKASRTVSYGTAQTEK